MWDIDKSLCARLEVDFDYVRNNPNIAKKFMFPTETQSLRKYADFFAWSNNSIYKELLWFEDFFLR